MNMSIGGWIFVGGLVLLVVLGIQLFVKGAIDRSKAKAILSDDVTAVSTASKGVVAQMKKLFSRSGT